MRRRLITAPVSLPPTFDFRRTAAAPRASPAAAVTCSTQEKYDVDVCFPKHLDATNALRPINTVKPDKICRAEGLDRLCDSSATTSSTVAKAGGTHWRK